MRRPISRRNVLLASGSALALPGCTGIDGPINDNSSNGTSPTAELEIHPPGIEEGDVVDNFEDLDLWSPGGGNFDTDESTAVHGTQSLRLQGASGESAGVYRTLDDPIDLSDRHLSLAVNVDTPGAARITVDLLAPDRQNMLRSQRYVGSTLSGWMRMDVGYTNRDGEPDRTAIQEIRLNVRSLDDEAIDCWCDDLRATNGNESPGATLVLTNAWEEYYDRVMPVLGSRGDPAVVPAWESGIGAPGRLDIEQLRSMRDTGWEIASRPNTGQSLPSFDGDEQREVIEANRSYLEGRGFSTGPRHCIPTGYQMDAETIEAIRELHETGITFGGAPNANPPVTRETVSLFNGDAGDSTRRLIDFAGEYNQSIVLGFSQIDDEGDFTLDDFNDVLDALDEAGYEIVTLSQLFGL